MLFLFRQEENDTLISTRIESSPIHLPTSLMIMRSMGKCRNPVRWLACALSSLFVVVIVVVAEGQQMRASHARQSPNASAMGNVNTVDMKHHRHNQRPQQEQTTVLLGQVNDDNGKHERHLTGLEYYETLSKLEKQFYMSKPDFTYQGYEITLNYNISDQIDPSSLDFRLYDGIECRRGSNEIDLSREDSDYLFLSYKLDNTIVNNVFTHRIDDADNTTFQHVGVKIRIDTAKIRDTPLFMDYGSFEHINFCVKVAVFHDEEGLNEPIEVNWRETPVLLKLNSLAFDVERDNSSSAASPFDNAYSVYETRELEVEVCGNDNNTSSTTIIDGSTIDREKGQKVSVCVKLGSKTKSDGGSLVYIEDFSFDGTTSSSDSNPSQLAIEPRTGGQPASSASEPLQCDLDTGMCSFDTYLSPEFFFNSAATIIDAHGTALLQFGKIKSTTDGNFENSNNDCCRIVPIQFGLTMVTLPAEDHSGGSSSFFSKYYDPLIPLGLSSSMLLSPFLF